MTRKPDILGPRATGPRRKLALWSAAGALLLAAGLALLDPATPLGPPALSRPAPPRPEASALPAVTAAPDPEPALAPAETLPPESAPPAEPPVAAPDEEQTLYLTIVGDKVYRVMGPVSGRPPRLDQLPGLTNLQRTVDRDPAGVMPDQPGEGVVIADSESPAPVLGPGERPLGPAPQECPRTLPPGSDQATADGLRRQSGCRYLSSCTADTNECTFYYQGRG